MSTEISSQPRPPVARVTTDAKEVVFHLRGGEAVYNAFGDLPPALREHAHINLDARMPTLTVPLKPELGVGAYIGLMHHSSTAAIEAVASTLTRAMKAAPFRGLDISGMSAAISAAAETMGPEGIAHTHDATSRSVEAGKNAR